MRHWLAAVVWIPMLTVGMAAQSGTTAEKKPESKPAPPAVVTLTGCVGGGKSAGDPFTLTSADGTVAYKLSGKNMRQYLGRQVTIVGNNDTRKLKVVGGLVPSANVAAQAGAMDPTRAAVASDPLSTAAKNDQQLPEFRVKAVQTSGASCR
jgi:adenylylsulfate kinase-like enzyme